MSSAAIPKTYGQRPPYGGGPPIRTSFDGSPSEDPDDRFIRLEESVRSLLASIRITPIERLDTVLRLLQQRRAWLEEDLRFERLLGMKTLPPFDFGDREDLFSVENKTEAKLVNLLGEIDDAIVMVEAKIEALNWRPKTSDS